jgi:predicted aspartyl protease
MTIFENNNVIIAAFKDPKDAESNYQRLVDAGYDQEAISIIMSEDIHNEYFSDKENVPPQTVGNQSLEGLGIGAATGGIIGGIAAAIAAMGTVLSLPALGLTISGPLVAALAGAGAGATTGGLVGALVGLGLGDEKAQALNEMVESGSIVLIVKIDNEEDRNLILSNLDDSASTHEQLIA